MRVKSIHLHNFKRFTDLLIDKIPESARVVAVVGPAGCGKSSLFDAFIQWYRENTGFGRVGDELYYRKDQTQVWNVRVDLHGNTSPRRGSLYVRTAYRNEPDFSVGGLSRPQAPSESMRLARVIENDQTVSENYQRLVYETTAAVYDVANDDMSVRDLREELIGQVRASMERVFGNLILNNISDPLGQGSFFFKKGDAESFHYKNLSGGEKAAFDLLLDFHIKKKYLPDAIYCVDEVEAHLHTRVQGALLRELARILPEQSQLWVTTHSIGVLRAAQELEAEEPGSVCIIEFEGVDPDTVTELYPVTLGRVSWNKLLSIALDDVSERIAHRVVVVCEGSSDGKRRKDFDAEIYNRIFGSRVTDILFVSGGSASQVLEVGVSVQQVLSQILPRTKVLSLLDRDDRSDQEVKDLESRGCIVLSKRNLESYLFADDVIEALVKREGKEDRLGDALEVKRSALERNSNREKPLDDLKPAAGEIYVGLKQLLGLTRCGNNADGFMRDTLAPLIVPGMKTYDDLKADIIDKIT